MNILKALGMIAVVGGHCGINFLPWFPVYSFHMPLFIFISGYFFRDSDFISFAKSKIKHLVIPLLSWNLVFGFVCTILLSYGLIHFGEPLSLKSLFVKPFSHGHQYVFNLATWFVGTLVELQFVYWALHRLCRRNHIALLLVTLICYLAAWTMADNHWRVVYGSVFLPIEKVLFMLIFYELGAVYKLYLEKLDSFSIDRIVGLVIFNGLLLGFVNRSITTGISWMKVPHQILLPLVTAMSGIYLYMQVSELLKDKVKRDSLLGFIGEHTFPIMTLHLFFFWLLNGCFYFIKQWGLFPLRSFDYNKFTHNIWFRISEHAPMNDAFYLLAGLGGSMLCVYLYEKAKPRLWQYGRVLWHKVSA